MNEDGAELEEEAALEEEEEEEALDDEVDKAAASPPAAASCAAASRSPSSAMSDATAGAGGSSSSRQRFMRSATRARIMSTSSVDCMAWRVRRSSSVSSPMMRRAMPCTISTVAAESGSESTASARAKIAAPFSIVLLGFRRCVEV